MPYKNKEDRNKNASKYREKNREKLRKKNKEYNQTEKGKKTKRINQWKNKGIIDEDLSAVYDYLIEQTHCMICLKEYKNSNDRHLDHDHNLIDEPNIRYICCRYCNSNFLRE